MRWVLLSKPPHEKVSSFISTFLAKFCSRPSKSKRSHWKHNTQGKQYRLNVFRKHLKWPAVSKNLLLAPRSTSFVTTARQVKKNYEYKIYRLKTKECGCLKTKPTLFRYKYVSDKSKDGRRLGIKPFFYSTHRISRHSNVMRLMRKLSPQV